MKDKIKRLKKLLEESRSGDSRKKETKTWSESTHHTAIKLASDREVLED